MRFEENCAGENKERGSDSDREAGRGERGRMEDLGHWWWWWWVVEQPGAAAALTLGWEAWARLQAQVIRRGACGCRISDYDTGERKRRRRESRMFQYLLN